MRNRKNVIFTMLLVAGLFCTNILLAKNKLCIKSKEPTFIEATENTAVIYLLHKDVSKLEQYFAIDDSLFLILPNKSFTVFSVEPGWHLLTVSQKDLSMIESFKIYCYPGEVQVLNIVSCYEKNEKKYVEVDDSIDEKMKKSLNPGGKYILSFHNLCHGFFFDRYPSDSIQRIVKKRKLKYAEITAEGKTEIMKFFDAAVRYRNISASKKITGLKLNFVDAVRSYQLPVDPPQWSKNGWAFKWKTAPGNKGLMKLGMSKTSDVIVNKDGIDIKNKKKPKLNIFIPFANITGFERILMMGKISPPFYLTVNYLEEEEEKQYRFFSGDSNPYESDSCRVYVNDISYRGKVNIDTGKRIESLDVHETQVTGYHKLVNLIDVMFWFEREKARLD
jgi:hypothetical protein